MKPYQLQGLSFLVYLYKNGLSGILGDEMGLGKTLQTLSLIQYLKENPNPANIGESERPFLVICPLSVLSSWVAEARKWAPELKILRFHGPSHERDRLKRIATGAEDIHGIPIRMAAPGRGNRRIGAGVDVVLTTYETFTSEKEWFKRVFVWRYTILDEGHKIKNNLSLISSALQGLSSEYRLILTGTPLQNNLTELWALLHWLYPEVFTKNTSDFFKNSFDLSHGKVDTTFIDHSRRLLELIMLRRMKSSPGVELGLPPKTEILLFVPLSPMQRFWYTRMLTNTNKGLLEELFIGAKEKEQATQTDMSHTESWENKDIDELELLDEQGALGADWEESKAIMTKALEQERTDDKKNSAWQKLMNLLMQLRKCCNHPYTLAGAAPEPYFLGEHVIAASGKMIVLEKLVDRLVLNEKKKVLIFSGFTKMLDLVEDLLALRGGDGRKFKYTRLDGRTSRARRNLGIRLFNEPDSIYKIMLISTRAGGLGVNLATASDVIMLDQDFNPQIMLQAEARAHRIGQKNPVTIYKLISQATVEEQMMGRIQKKLYLSAKVTESMRNIHSTSRRDRKKGPTGLEDDAPHLGTSELFTLVRRGTQALTHPQIDVDQMRGWEFEEMIDKCRDRPADYHVSEELSSRDNISKEDEHKWLSQMEQISTEIFEGQKLSRKKNKNNSLELDLDRKDRREGKNTTVMVGGFAISKESMGCAAWEAVPTLAGKDPRLADIKRDKKLEIQNQGHCQKCWDGGDIVVCSSCPRSYHIDCLPNQTFKARAESSYQFHCPQHECVDCSRKTTDAGGMIYRCRWCERGFCEDCLDWSKVQLIGENLKEYELLGYPEVVQAFYVKCPRCVDFHTENPHAQAFCESHADDYNKQHNLMSMGSSASAPELPDFEAESLTDATTLDDSGVTTPQTFEAEITASGRKRKAAVAALSTLSRPAKRPIIRLLVHPE